MKARVLRTARESGDDRPPSKIKEYIIILNIYFIYFCVILGVTLAKCVSALMGDPPGVAPTLYTFCILATVPSALWIGAYGGHKRPIGMIDLLLPLILLTGLPGALLNTKHTFMDTNDRYPEINFFIFLICLIIRCYTLFAIIPSAITAHWRRRKPEDGLMMWCMIASLTVVVGSLWFSTKEGITLNSAERLHGSASGWLHANHMGNYAAACIMCSILSRSVPVWLRTAFVLLATYILILTQSRTSIASIIIIFSIYISCLGYERGRLVNWALCISPVILILGMVALFMLPAISDIPMISKIVERTTADDPTSGRVDIFSHFFTVFFRKSPAFGFGYRCSFSRLDNGYVSLAAETGLAGVALYSIFIFLIFIKILIFCYNSNSPQRKRYAIIYICFTSYIILRSIAECSHAFMMSEPMSNAWLILSGYMYHFPPEPPPCQPGTRWNLSGPPRVAAPPAGKRILS